MSGISCSRISAPAFVLPNKREGVHHEEEEKELDTEQAIISPKNEKQQFYDPLWTTQASILTTQESSRRVLPVMRAPALPRLASQGLLWCVI